MKPMRILTLLRGLLASWIIYLSVLFLTSCGNAPLFNPEQLETHTKPWTRWWWMGNSVTREGITQHLEAFEKAGLGGVEIVPIYGEKGDESNFIEYLSDEWIGMLLHTLREAERLNLGVDMTLGSGWPYGGPWITEQYAAKRVSTLFPDGQLTGQMVKRAAPGGEGLVVDHFNPEAMRFFLTRFDSLMQLIKKENLSLRAIFNDSYEVYGADWTKGFREVFRERIGYDFPENFLLKENYDENDLDYWQDYHLFINHQIKVTVGENILRWCTDHDVQYRYQAHGSPSNLLDLYGLASIPETEAFGSSKFNIPLVDYDKDYSEEQFSRPHPLIYKFASSPAHLLGKPLVSAETGTWLADHFKVSLSQVKPQLDQLFVSGINHIFYHGIPYSPFEKGFPGRQFYASTNFGPNSALWEYIDNMNDYIKNCQLLLQNTDPDNDILLYFPVYDLWYNEGIDGNIIMQGVHNPESWLFDTPFGNTAQSLLDAGYTFDYISDNQIAFLANNLDERAVKYKAMVIPPCKFADVQTLIHIAELIDKGYPVIFLESYPHETLGITTEYIMNENNQVLASKDWPDPIKNELTTISDTLAKYDIWPESFPGLGLEFIRKAHPGGFVYFITNLNSTDFNGFCSMARDFEAVEIYDPISEKRGEAQIRKSEEGKQIRLQLKAGQSLFLITYHKLIDQKDWKYQGERGRAIDLNSNWTFRLEDPKNGFHLKDYQLDSLMSWTRLPFPWAPYYTGSATYCIDFDFPINDQEIDAVILDLGDLRYMATAALNGKMIGDFWSVPFQKTIPIDKFESKNTLVINVSNLDANQVILLDKSGIPWKNFYDINFVDIRYRAFDASTWEPMPSGLLGPVTLIPVDLD